MPDRRTVPVPPQCFLSSAFKYAPPHEEWPPVLSDRHKADLAQAHYGEQEISELAKNWAVLCSKCLQWGHPKISCPVRIICLKCSAPGHKASDCPLIHTMATNLGQSPSPGNVILDHANKGNLPTRSGRPKSSTTVRCSDCGFYGHVARSCLKRIRARRWKWIPKKSLPSQDGLVPENNITDSAAQAWNDSIIISDDVSSAGSDGALIVVDSPALPLVTESLNITVDVRSTGIQFALSGQGDEILALLLANPIPRFQLNTILLDAIRPMLSTVGPWMHGYGASGDFLRINLHLAQTEGTSNCTLSMQSLIVQESSPSQSVQLLEIPDTTADQTQALITENADDASGGSFDSESVMVAHDGADSGMPDSFSHNMTQPMLTATSQPSMDVQLAPGPSTRKRRGKLTAPVDSANLRRSSRVNRYDGFRISQPSDNRVYTSKVKPRNTPAAPSSSTAASQNVEIQADEIPPPTPLQEMQSEGVNLCAVPEDELTEAALLAEDNGPSSSA